MNFFFKKKINLNNGHLQLGLIVLFIAGSLLVSFFLKSSYSTSTTNKVAERTLVVEAKEIKPIMHHVAFTSTGVIEPRNTIEIVPEVSGRVTSVSENFFPGRSFSKGDTLFTIDTRDFELEVSKQRAEVARAATALDLEKAESSVALSDWKKRHGTKEAHPLLARKPQLAEAQASLESAKALLEKAELDLKRTRFIFSFDGFVINSQITRDQYVQVGQSYGDVYEKSKLEVKASLEDRYLKWLLRDEPNEIKIKLNYLGEAREYSGALNRGVNTLDTDTRFANVYFEFVEDTEDLLPGIFVDIEVKGPDVDNVMLIPYSALQPGNIIWRLQDNHLELWKPNIIHYDESYLIVKGLSEPNIIVTSKVTGAADGMKVEIRNSYE